MLSADGLWSLSTPRSHLHIVQLRSLGRSTHGCCHLGDLPSCCQSRCTTKHHLDIWLLGQRNRKTDQCWSSKGNAKEPCWPWPTCLPHSALGLACSLCHTMLPFLLPSVLILLERSCLHPSACPSPSLSPHQSVSPPVFSLHTGSHILFSHPISVPRAPATRFMHLP